MDRLSFEKLDDYLDYIEHLLKQKVVDIIKVGYQHYEFKIGDDWFRLTFHQLVGTNFRNGNCLILEKGCDRSFWHILHNNQTKDKRTVGLFEKLDDLYVQRIIVDNVLIKEMSKSILEFLCHVDKVERFSEYLYLVTRADTEYAIVCEHDYRDGCFQKVIKIKKIVKFDGKVIDEIRGDDFVSCILRFLDVIYYTMNLDDAQSAKDRLLKTIK